MVTINSYPPQVQIYLTEEKLLRFHPIPANQFETIFIVTHNQTGCLRPIALKIPT